MLCPLSLYPVAQLLEIRLGLRRECWHVIRPMDMPQNQIRVFKVGPHESQHRIFCMSHSHWRLAKRMQFGLGNQRQVAIRPFSRSRNARFLDRWQYEMQAEGQSKALEGFNVRLTTVKLDATSHNRLFYPSMGRVDQLNCA